MDWDWCAGQNSRIDPADIRDVDKSVHDAGDHETDGVHVGFKDGAVEVDLYVCVRHGMRIPAVALKLQETVKEALSDSLGIRVSAVNVNVSQVIFDKDKAK